MVNEAAALVRRHRLRGFDAVHLSCAVLLHAGAPGEFTFAVADRRLVTAAVAEGITVHDLH